MPPPVTQILMASGFSRRRMRMAWRSSHGPSTWSPQGWPVLDISNGSLWQSPWPAVRQKPRPVAKMRGPFMTPMFTRSRMAMPLRPISHTVVRPWVTASYACFTAQACFWATVSMTQSFGEVAREVDVRVDDARHDGAARDIAHLIALGDLGGGAGVGDLLVVYQHQAVLDRRCARTVYELATLERDLAHNNTSNSHKPLSVAYR